MKVKRFAEEQITYALAEWIRERYAVSVRKAIELWKVSRKRLYRWYRLAGLHIRMHVRRRKHMSLHRGSITQARRTHERWSMDLVHDQLFGGRDVVAALDRVIDGTGTPVSITIDHGMEFTSKVFEEWAYRRGVKLDFIHPGKPTENGPSNRSMGAAR